MRRLWLVVGALAIAGCSNFRDLFSAHAESAAEAGELTLTPERLAEILTGPKGVRLNSEAANFVTGMWVDYALFAQAVADNRLPTDSAAIAATLWPDIAQIRSDRWHDSLVARRTAFGPEKLDSLYNGDSFRIFQHMLFPVSQTATPEERSAARGKAEGAIAQLERGANFGELAGRISEDPQTARDSGYLPPSTRGQFVTAFDSAGWSLAAGQRSGVVETPYGYHVIRRPGPVELGDRLRQAGMALVTQRLDSLYFDSLATAQQLRMKSGAAGTMRDALANREKARRSDKAIATFKGGELTVREFLRWVDQIPVPYQQQLAQLPDTQMTQYGRTIAQNLLLLQDADAAKIALTPVEWQGMRQQYLAQVDSLKAEMGLGVDVADSSVGAGDRTRLAEMKVQTYFDKLIAGQIRLRRIPATLSQVLRDNLEYDIHDGGVARGLQIAQRMQASADSTSLQQGQQQVAPGMQPAPGPAPMQASPDSPPADTTARPGGR